MQLLERLTTWLETYWVNPAYSGWLVSGLAIFFFAAATNTMAGWLYAISGAMLAVLGLAAVLPIQTLRGVRLHRVAIAPVSVGEPLRLQVQVENQTQQPKTLIQLLDLLPQPLPPIRTAIEQIPAASTYDWMAELPTERRGVYRWQTIQMRTAAPLGLFWRRRSDQIKSKAVVYPTVLSLSQCPIVDALGQEADPQMQSYYQAQLATEGVTRTLRPYRWGDSTRLIHWRSSARYGELRVRELETYIGGQDLVIGLDSASPWEADCFEQAVIAAASLYFYATHRQIQTRLWTAGTGLVRGDQAVLETLAAVQFSEAAIAEPPLLPMLWLTQTADRLAVLPAGSRWLLWQAPEARDHSLVSALPNSQVGRVILLDQPLQSQLQGG